MNLSPSTTTVLAPLAGLPDGQLSERELSIAGELESVLLLRHGEQVKGWLNVCPHAGRRLDYAPGMFLLSAAGEVVCPVHGATFELEQGLCTAGPCRGQSLRALPLQVVDGQVLLLAL